MTTTEVVKQVMKTRNFTNQTLADKLGYKYASGVSERFRSDMRVSTLLKMLDTMGCELVVRSKLSDKGQWVIDGKDDKISPEEQRELLK